MKFFILAILTTLQMSAYAQVEAIGKPFTWVQTNYPDGVDSFEDGTNLYYVDTPGGYLGFGMNESMVCNLVLLSPNSIEIQLGLLEVLNNSDDVSKKLDEYGNVYWQIVSNSLVITVNHLEGWMILGSFYSQHLT